MHAIASHSLIRRVSSVSQTYHPSLKGIQDVVDLIVKEAVNGIHPSKKIGHHVRYDSQKKLTVFGKHVASHVVISTGKDSLSLAKSFLLVSKATDLEKMIVVYKHATKEEIDDLNKLSKGKALLLQGDHPYPGQNSANVQKNLLDLASNTKSNTTVIGLISGGTSSLINYAPGLHDFRKKALDSGLPIGTINKEFRNFAPLAGGKLANAFSNVPYYKIFGLYISDVDGGIEDIGSGPLISLTQTNDNHKVIASKAMMLDHLETVLKKQGFDVIKKDPSYLSSNPSIKIPMLLNEANQLNVSRPTIIIASGEAEHQVCKNPGFGGRNQYCAALASSHCNRNVSGVFFGVDGDDGLCDTDEIPVSGAWFDADTEQRGAHSGMNLKSYRDNDNLFPFFKKINQHVRLEQTVNVSDGCAILILPKQRSHYVNII